MNIWSKFTPSMCVILATVGLLMLASQVQANDNTGLMTIEPYNPLSEQHQAKVQLLALLQQAQHRQDPKILTQQEAMVMIVELTQPKLLAQASSLKLPRLFEMCDAAMEVSSGFLGYELPLNDDVNTVISALGRGEVAAEDRNFLYFEAQLQRLQSFTTRCLAEQISPLTAFVESLPQTARTSTRMSGLSKASAGITQLFVSTLAAAFLPSVSISYRESIMMALADSADEFVSSMSLAQRQQLLEQLNQRQSQLVPELQPYYLTIKKALTNQQCVGICALNTTAN
ncbi:hypothetical protein [Shewanella sp. NIFS-20-20]|uniref:hypothetical protein n=1 Tax=Shewanella sp. NIFS-20-20 TaxID=2853806 RepID=UPI001C436A75|nr:hypothetical protein [Shewanella sp. NIFS-20-20]MBV7317567.1 hypothetical protein [Shewanella sp. NIFS-20-20]